MAQPTMADPRSEVLAASRNRSGSTKLEGGLDQALIVDSPPKPTAATATTSGRPSQFGNLRSRFEDKDGSGGGGGGGKLYIPNVSRIKEKFLHSGGDVGTGSSEGKADGAAATHAHQPGSRLSPETKRKKTGEHSINSSSSLSSPAISPGLDPKRRSAEFNNPPMSPTHQSISASAAPVVSSSIPDSSRRRKSGDSAGRGFRTQDPSDSSSRYLGPTTDQRPVETTSHVQRFNLTRALFARMEEENRLAQQKEQVGRLRKLSPSRIASSNSATSSPLLSPTIMSPSQEGKKFLQPAETRRSRSTSDSPSNLKNSLLNSPRSEPPDSRQRTRSSSGGSSHSLFGSADSLDEVAPVIRRSRQVAHSVMDDCTDGDGSGKFIQQTEETGLMHSKRIGDTKDKIEGEEESMDLISDQSQQSNTQVEEAASSVTLVDTNASPSRSSYSSSSFDHHSPRARSSHISGHSPGSGSPSVSSRQLMSSSKSSSLSSSPPRLHSKSAIGSNRAAPSSPLRNYPSASSPSQSASSSTVVMRGTRSSLQNGDDTAGAQAKKRLSKEEIDAALERADSYLANLGSPVESEPSTSTTKEDNHISSSKGARKRFSFEEENAVAEVEEVIEEVEATQVHAQQAAPPASNRDESLSRASSTSVPTVSSSSPPPANTVTTQSPTSSMSSLLSSSNDALFEPQRGLPPPSYRECSRPFVETDPPSYREATSASSMLVSQKVMQQQQMRKPTIPVRPTPIPRRAAPPPPTKKPIGEISTHPGAPPPPAPEPGNVEYAHDFRDTPGNRNAMIINADDLILPEEHMMPHKDDDDLDPKDKSVDLDLKDPSVDLDLKDKVDLDANDKAVHLDLVTRESGDGSEDAGDVDAISSDGEPFEIDYANLTYIEIPPISSSEDEDEDDSSADDEVDYHKPTKVSFCRTPIKVYATYSTNDYDRRNEDVDPVAASAEYELEKRVEKMDVFPVELLKGAEGLGLSIIGMGVGADAGLEKLGIFIKTLTQGGAAQRSATIQVNDQIIEVDGKSLVGVTQAYAASVLRNTSGIVKFMIGREKDPSKSEVARLIQQSLEQDRRREEMKEQESQRMKQLEDSFKPKDEVLESHMNNINKQSQSPFKNETVLDDKDTDSLQDGSSRNESPCSEQEEYDLEQGRLQMEAEESAAEDSTLLSGPPSTLDAILETSPENSENHTPQNEKDGSSISSIGSDLDYEKVIVKLKETQSKLAATESDIAKLQAKIVVFENSEGQKKATEKKLEELNRKFSEREKHFDALKKELSQYKDMMVASQSQHIELERKVRELGALEKKYHKAKKLIKDYQQRERDFIQERESLFEQQSEKDQQYNSLVKSLKDRIFTMEKDLTETRRAAGLPETLPPSEPLDMSITTAPPLSRLVTATFNGLDEPSMSPLNQSSEDVLETSTGSDMSDVASTPVHEEGDDTIVMETVNIAQSAPSPSQVGGEVEGDSGMAVDEPVSSSPHEFDAIINTNLLDSTPYRDKASIAASGSNANRRPPSKPPLVPLESDNSLVSEEQDSSSIRSDATDEGSTNSGQVDITAESGLDMWNKHDRKDDSASETSSSVSQASYDPNRPHAKGFLSEIPDGPASEEDATSKNNGGGGISLVSAKPTSSGKGFSLPKFHWKSSKGGNSSSDDGGGGGGGGVLLLSNRSLFGSKNSASDPGLDSSGGGITLISKKIIDTGYHHDPDVSSSGSDLPSSSAMMVTEPDEDSTGKFTLNISGTPAAEDNPAPNKRGQNQFHSLPITEWTTENVCHWLMGLELEKYTDLFRDKTITGSQLLQLDSSKLKTMGVTSSKDRELFKKKIKEMKANVEREKKQQEKERRQREKEQKKMAKKK